MHLPSLLHLYQKILLLAVLAQQIEHIPGAIPIHGQILYIQIGQILDVCLRYQAVQKSNENIFRQLCAENTFETVIREGIDELGLIATRLIYGYSFHS